MRGDWTLGDTWQRESICHDPGAEKRNLTVLNPTSLVHLFASEGWRSMQAVSSGAFLSEQALTINVPKYLCSGWRAGRRAHSVPGRCCKLPPTHGVNVTKLGQLEAG